MSPTRTLSKHAIHTLEYLHKKQGHPVSEIIKMKLSFLKGFSRSTIYKHATGKFGMKRQSAGNPVGRPRKLQERDMRSIARSVKTLRSQIGSFTTVQVQADANLNHLDNSTVRKAMYALGFKYLCARKKGVLTEQDAKKRRGWARKMKRAMGNEEDKKQSWRSGINMYADIVGFEFKRNPFEATKAPSAREWRKKNEGLGQGCTAKGKKEGKTCVKILVGITHGAGVTLCHPVEVVGRLKGIHFAQFVNDGLFEDGINSSVSPAARTILQDNCPVQNSNIAKAAFNAQNITIFRIPSRSPDLNPIENLFNQMKQQLRKQARDQLITKETKQQFSIRVQGMLKDFSHIRINNLIDSMPKRVDAVLEKKGWRIKY